MVHAVFRGASNPAVFRGSSRPAGKGLALSCLPAPAAAEGKLLSLAFFFLTFPLFYTSKAKPGTGCQSLPGSNEELLVWNILATEEQHPPGWRGGRRWWTDTVCTLAESCSSKSVQDSGAQQVKLKLGSAWFRKGFKLNVSMSDKHEPPAPTQWGLANCHWVSCSPPSFLPHYYSPPPITERSTQAHFYGKSSKCKQGLLLPLLTTLHIYRVAPSYIQPPPLALRWEESGTEEPPLPHGWWGWASGANGQRQGGTHSLGMCTSFFQRMRPAWLHGLFCLWQDAGSRPTPLTGRAHAYEDVYTCTTTQSLSREHGYCCAEPFLPRESSGKPGCGGRSQPALRNTLQHGDTRIWRREKGAFQVSLCFKKPEMDMLSRDCLNDATLLLSASLLVGLWYVKLNHWGAKPQHCSWVNSCLAGGKQAWPWPTTQLITLTAVL